MQEFNLLNEYYNTLINLKCAQKYIEDINILNYQYCNYKYNDAIVVLSKIITKYKKEINEIGKLYSAYEVVSDKSPEILYEKINKNNDEILDDIEYVINCIVIIASVYVGLENSIKDVILKLNAK